MAHRVDTTALPGPVLDVLFSVGGVFVLIAVAAIFIIGYQHRAKLRAKKMKRSKGRLKIRR